MVASYEVEVDENGDGVCKTLFVDNIPQAARIS